MLYHAFAWNAIGSGSIFVVSKSERKKTESVEQIWYDALILRASKVGGVHCLLCLRTLRPAIQTFRHGKPQASHFTSILFLISKRMSVLSAREKFGEHVRGVKAVGGDVMADCNRPFRKILQYSLFAPHKNCFCFL